MDLKKPSENLETQNCNDCHREFPTVKDYSIHRIGVHHDDLFTEPLSNCEFCGLTMEMCDLSSHTCTSVNSLLLFNSYAVFFCSDCNLSFDAYDKWSIHRVGVHHDDLINLRGGTEQDKVNRCGECNVDFGQEEELLMHRVNVHHGDLFQKPEAVCIGCEGCVICKNTRNAPRSILEGTFGCSDCQKQFLTKRELCVHRINVHHDDLYGEVATAPCPCEWCGLDYETDDQVISHICDILDGADGVPNDLRAVEVFDSLKCPSCPLQFREKLYLHRHYLRKHINQKRFLCSVCGFLTKYSNSFKKHEKSHLNTFRLQLKSRKDVKKCLQCGKCFLSRKGLLRHLLTHQDQKEEICPVEGCGKRFWTRSEVVKHEKTHRERNQTCFVCEEKFPCWRDLKQHLLRHMGLKRFVCERCGADFTRLRRLKLHLKDQHGIEC